MKGRTTSWDAAMRRSIEAKEIPHVAWTTLSMSMSSVARDARRFSHVLAIW
jgi:hypothetical protein